MCIPSGWLENEKKDKMNHADVASALSADFTPDVEIPVSLVADVSTEPLMLAVNVMNQGLRLCFPERKIKMRDGGHSYTRCLWVLDSNSDSSALPCFAKLVAIKTGPDVLA